MAIKPRVKEKQKKSLTQRDDVLMVLAFVAGGTLQYYSSTGGDLGLALGALSWVLYAIGAVILLGIVRNMTKKKPPPV